MNLLVSPVKDNLIAKKSRVFISVLLDYALVFVATLFLFYLTLLGSSHLPVSNETVEKYNQTVVKAQKYINTTHLMHYDTTTNKTKDVEEDAKEYVVSLLKTSAYVNDIAYPLEKEDSTFDRTHKVTVEETFIHEYNQYALDNISYFYFKFSKENADLDIYRYKDIDYKDDKVTYVYLKAMGYDTKEGFVDNFISETAEEYAPYKDLMPRYSILNKTNTEGLINKLVLDDDSNSDINSLYTNLKICYKNGIQHGISMVEQHSSVYKSYVSEFNKSYNVLALIAFFSYLIAYVVAYIGLIFLGRGMAGRFDTVVQKSMSLSFCRTDEMIPVAKNIIIYHTINFFVYLSSMVLAFLFTGYMGILNLTIVGPINLFVIELALLILGVSSLIIIGVSKKNQSLALLASGMTIKDTRTFESSVVSDDKLLTQSLENGNESSQKN